MKRLATPAENVAGSARPPQSAQLWASLLAVMFCFPRFGAQLRGLVVPPQLRSFNVAVREARAVTEEAFYGPPSRSSRLSWGRVSPKREAATQKRCLRRDVDIWSWKFLNVMQTSAPQTVPSGDFFS